MARAFRRKRKIDCSIPFSAPRREAPVWVCRLRPGLLTGMAARWNSRLLGARARPSASCCQFTAMEDEAMATILIIDDDKSDAGGAPEALKAALSQNGHEVEIATDAEEGLALAKERDAFDVVFADLSWSWR